MNKIILFFVMIIGVSLNSLAQDLSLHQWENRLLLILSDAQESELAIKQIETLQKDVSGLKERKLVVYRATSKEYLKGLMTGEWNQSEKLHKIYNKSNEAFKVVLIGLDGSVKMTKTSLLYKEELYGKIDSMPMRMNELKSR